MGFSKKNPYLAYLSKDLFMKGLYNSPRGTRLERLLEDMIQQLYLAGPLTEEPDFVDLLRQSPLYQDLVLLDLFMQKRSYQKWSTLLHFRLLQRQLSTCGPAMVHRQQEDFIILQRPPYAWFLSAQSLSSGSRR